MAVLPAPYRFTVEEYERLGEVGFFHEHDRVELLEGEIVQMAPIGVRHATCVRKVNRVFNARFAGRATVDPQNPVVLPPESEPQPDIVLLQPRPDDYLSGHPQPADVLLLVEVSDTTVTWDRNRKIPIYAAAGISEVWLADLTADAMEVYRQPEGRAYLDVAVKGRDDAVAPTAFPEEFLAVADLLP
jgi:Uma2 family endonuclease